MFSFDKMNIAKVGVEETQKIPKNYRIEKSLETTNKTHGFLGVFNLMVF